MTISSHFTSILLMSTTSLTTKLILWSALCTMGAQVKAENIRGYVSELANPDAPIFSSRGHPKSPGFTVELKYPASWRVAEGTRPAILQKFRSKGGQGLLTVLLNVVPVPPEAGLATEIKEELKYFSSEDAAAMLPKGATLLGLERTNIDGEQSMMMEFAHNANSAGIDIEMRGLQFCTFVDHNMFVLSGTLTKGAKWGSDEFEKEWQVAKLAIKAMAGSVYFPDKWQQPKGENAKPMAVAVLDKNGVRHKSEEFRFSAIFPDEVEPLVVPYKMGRIGTFQAVDEQNKLLVMVTANFVPAAELAVANNESTPQRLIEAMVLRNAQEHGASKTSIETKTATLNGKPAMEFNYTTRGFAPERIRTQHFGKSVFVVDTFYHLQVVAFEEDNNAKEALKRLVESFTLQTDE